MEVVIIELKGQHYGLPAASVVEVLDALPVTPLPFAPAYVDGLVNVAGRVVPQLDAALRLGGTEAVATDQGSVLVVTACGAPCAVHVDKVLTKASIPEEEIARREGRPAPAADVETTETAETAETIAMIAVTGEFPWHGRSVLLVDADVFSIDGVVPVGVPESGGGLLGQAVLVIEGSAAEADTGGLACLVVACRGERYALPLSEVGEVVDVGAITRLPHAPREMRGLALLRGSPLLALSLGVLLGGRDDAAEPVMVVVDAGGHRLGLLVERVIGIERFAADALQEAHDGREIGGYLVGRDGAMVGLLKLAGLLTDERIADYRGFLISSRLENAMSHQTGQTDTVRRLLAFRVGREYCALPLEWVERIEEYQAVTDVPHDTEAGLTGVVQIQGEVALVVNLGRVMGLAGVGHGAFLVVRLDGALWALAVDRVERMVDIRESDIEPVKRAANDYIDAVGRLDGRLLSILTLAPLRDAA